MEHLVGYAKHDLMVPLQLSEAPVIGADLGQLNTAVAAWCGEVNAAMHSEIAAVPAQRLVTEQQLLGLLPSLRLEVGPRSITRKVDNCRASGSPQAATRCRTG